MGKREGREVGDKGEERKYKEEKGSEGRNKGR